MCSSCHRKYETGSPRRVLIFAGNVAGIIELRQMRSYLTGATVNVLCLLGPHIIVDALESVFDLCFAFADKPARQVTCWPFMTRCVAFMHLSIR